MSRFCRGKIAAAVGLWCVLLWLVLRVGWMSDDGLINVRAALNLQHGNGAGFNVGERVQAFTSPLWFFVEYVVGVVSGEFILGAIVIGAVFSVGALHVIAHRALTSGHALAVVVLFALSASLVDFSTSGLENGLGMLAIATTIAAADRVLKWHRWWGLLGLTLATVVLTRFDYVLLVGPLGILVLIESFRHGWRATARLAGGVITPLVGWFAISWLYFGSLLPNTFKAKLNVEIPRSELLVSGVRFMIVSAEADPVIIVIIIAGILGAIATGRRRHLAVAIGIVLYVAYTVYIGGDFMAGRFLTGTAVAALSIIATTNFGESQTTTRSVVAGLIAVGVAFGATPMIIDRPSYDSPQRWEFWTRGGIADEAGYYRQGGWSMPAVFLETEGDFDFPAWERSPVRLWQLRRLEDRWTHVEPDPKGTARRLAVYCGALGGAGMQGGPTLFVIDSCALTDAFLADIAWQPEAAYQWRVGHYERVLPAGYEDAVRFADPSYVTDPDLRRALERLWDRIR